MASAQALPLGVWENIAFRAEADANTFLGPPSTLGALALVSRTISASVSVANNTRLYARLFRFKFDDGAPTRRLSARWMTTRCLAQEFVKRFQALRRIKDCQYHPDDLWTVYLMLSENDSKNASQLLRWGNLRRFVAELVSVRLRLRQSWGSEPLVDALLAWIIWMTDSETGIGVEDVETRRNMLFVLHPFIATGFRYPATYAPDNYFDLPWEPSQPFGSHCSGPPPAVTTITHYSHKLTVVVPLVTTAALLATTVRRESAQNAENFRVDHRIPRDRATAQAQGFVGPTLEDIRHYHFHTRIHLPDLRIFTTPTDSTEGDVQTEPDGEPLVDSKKGSMQYDHDWSRVVSCYDPCSTGSPLRGTVYELGALSGSWAGRYVNPELEQQVTLHRRPLQISPFSVRLLEQPLYWTLQEHHCLGPDQPLGPGVDETGGEDMLNAWLPRGATLTPVEGGIEVFNPHSGQTTRYETYNSGAMAPYSEEASKKIESCWVSGTNEEIAGDISNPESFVPLGPTYPDNSYIDDDNEYVDEVSYRTSGVSDILLTGETGQRHGDAWGQFSIIGRVRSWDGFVVLLRTPLDPLNTHLGRWVFKGYLHGRNFVGRWREVSTPIGMAGFEGCFVVAKVE